MKYLALFLSLIVIDANAYLLDYKPIDIESIINEKATTQKINLFSIIESCDNVNLLKEQVTELENTKFIDCSMIDGRDFLVLETSIDLGGGSSPKTLSLHANGNDEFGLDVNDEWMMKLNEIAHNYLFLIKLKNNSDKHYQSVSSTSAPIFNNYPSNVNRHWLKPDEEVNVIVPLLSPNYKPLMEGQKLREPSKLFIKTNKLADTGNAEAQYQLGNMYEKDTVHIQRDRDMAFEWHKKAADHGDAIAQYITSENDYWMANVKNKVNMKRLSIEYLNKSAAQNDPVAQKHLAEHYLTGSYLKKDPQKALLLLKASAEQGNERAQTELGRQTFNMGDKVTGYAWYSIAAYSVKYDEDTLNNMEKQMTIDELRKATILSKELKRKYPVKKFAYE
ncbi:tetratricopeptide repeat protein [Providencia stuartii]|uniref:tetratricopeptide repeat protein n=1 Tax=Providencia stuartii TaxID=588 RepID=UPI0018C680CD|nr:tetratricopeptide repeat protein [Providencia stuartii]EMD1716805.1 sel1 repeat family protein [Providencia stuartii]MBG5909152.1 sel1 repeat family protein [Providencia stuartii]WAZ74213.1 tetratricopeptide repeat protein [Providencia stuartii]HEM6895692.1 sel1 repeat family protein [Providencia stuartii]